MTNPEPPEQPQPVPACADFPSSGNDRQELAMFITPLVSGYTLSQQQTIITHELGHNLGFAHYNADPSIMHTAPENPYLYTQPQAIDIAHYHTAYSPLAPTLAQNPQTPAPGQVMLTWTDNSWNEESFAIYRGGARGSGQRRGIPARYF